MDMVAAVIAAVAVVALGTLLERRRVSHAQVIKLIVASDAIEIRLPSGELVWTCEPVIRVAAGAAGLPRILNFGARGTEVHRYDLSSVEVPRPDGAVFNAFVTACCLEARKSMRISALRPLRLQVEFRLPNAAASTYLGSALSSRYLRRTGVFLT